MGYCKDCKHSTTIPENLSCMPGYRFNFIGCGNSKIRQGYNEDLLDIKEDEMLVENDEGWGFVVGTHFGCIHFKEKE